MARSIIQSKQHSTNAANVWLWLHNIILISKHSIIYKSKKVQTKLTKKLNVMHNEIIKTLQKFYTLVNTKLLQHHHKNTIYQVGQKIGTPFNDVNNKMRYKLQQHTVWTTLAFAINYLQYKCAHKHKLVYISRWRTTSFNENDARVNQNCKHDALNKRGNSNTKRVSFFGPPCILSQPITNACDGNTYVVNEFLHNDCWDQKRIKTIEAQWHEIYKLIISNLAAYSLVHVH